MLCYSRLLTLLLFAFSLNGCTTIMVINEATTGRITDQEYGCKINKAYISPGGILSISDSCYIPTSSNPVPQDRTITIDIKKEADRYKVNNYRGDVRPLPRSVIKMGRETERPVDYVEIPLQEIDINATSSSEAGKEYNGFDIKRASLKPISGHDQTLYVTYTSEYSNHNADFPEWTLVSNSELCCGKNHVSFNVAPIKTKKLGLLLLTPFTVLVDAVTSPIQLIFFLKNPRFIDG